MMKPVLATPISVVRLPPLPEAAPCISVVLPQASGAWGRRRSASWLLGSGPGCPPSGRGFSLGFLLGCPQLLALLASPLNQVVGKRPQSSLRRLRRVRTNEECPRRHPELVVVGHWDLPEFGLKRLEDLANLGL